MEGDKKLCKASLVAQSLGHAASTLALFIGMDQDKVLTLVQKLSLLVPPSLSFFLSFFLSFSFSVLSLLLDRTDVCSPLLRLFSALFSRQN